MCGEAEYRTLLAELWTQGVLYGIYVMLFAGSVYVLTIRRPHRYYLILSILMFTFTTVITVLDMAERLLTPISTTKSYDMYGALNPCITPESQAQIRESIVGNKLFIIEDAMVSVNFILADGLLIFRCAIVWGSKRWVAVPSALLLLATTVCNFAGVYYDAELYLLFESFYPGIAPLPPQIAIVDLTAQFSEASIVLSLATNLITTFLIALRIWTMTRDIEETCGRSAGAKYRAVIAMLIESGALFSASLVVTLVLTFLSVDSSIANSISTDLMVIAPTLIMVRTGMVRTPQGSIHLSHISDRLVPASRWVLRADGVAETVPGIHFPTLDEMRRNDSGEGRVESLDIVGAAV